MKALQIQAPENYREEISESIEDLSEISSQFCANDFDKRQILDAYRSRLQQMDAILSETEYTGLLDLIKIFIEGVEALVESGRELNNGECRFLLQFPNHLIEYFSLPLSKLPGKLMVRFFKNPEWIRPISDKEEDIIYDQICQQTERVDYLDKKKRGFIDEEIEQKLDEEIINSHQDEEVASADETEEPSSSNNQNEYLEESDLQFTQSDIGLTEIDSSTEEVLDVDEITSNHGSIASELEDASDNAVAIEEFVNNTTVSDEDFSPDTISDAPQFSREISEDDKSEDSDNESSEIDVHDLLGNIDHSNDDELEITTDSADKSAEISLSEFNDSNTEDVLESDEESSDSISVDLSTLINTDATDSVEGDLQSSVDISDDDILKDGGDEATEVDVLDLLGNIDQGNDNSNDNEQETVDESTDEPVEISLGEFKTSGTDNSAKSDEEVSAEISIDLSAFISIDAAEDDLHADNNEDEQVVDIVEANETNHTCDVDEKQQLLIDLVRAELAEVLDDRDTDISTLKNESDQEIRQHLLLNYAEQAENISNAVELIGLEGLSQSSHFISDNLSQLANDADNFNQQQYQLLYDWPEKLFEYLQTINQHVDGEKLVDFLSLEFWPIKLEDEPKAQILKLLNNPVLEEEEKQQRQTIATADDVTLTLPEDVNQELLDGLLQDLPEQTEEFSSAIEHLKISGSKDDIETAQRIAHTLKGAANVVGVRGVASLTHHLEDILEYLSTSNQTPTDELLLVLVNASDCLQGMTESLLGLDAEPEESLEVLQSILDWANRFDNGDVSQPVVSKITEPDVSAVEESINNQVASVESKETNISNESAIEPKSAVEESSNTRQAENVLRIPVSLADEMLRIAGESLISNTQIEDKINNSLKRQESFALQSSHIQQISFDLEYLIDIQGITSAFTSNEQHDDFDALEMDKFHELHSVSRRLVEVSADSLQLSQVLKSELSELKNLVIDQDKLQKTNQELVLRTRMVPVKSIVPRLKRGVRQACRLTGKNVDLHFYDNDTYMDSEVLNEMIEPLMHVLRNAVDHGIEDEAVRKEAGKPLTGSISITSKRNGNTVDIEIKDDGKGLDYEKIIQKASNKGMIAVVNELTDEDVYRLILEPGFSTRDDVTQTSGRGIGLDVVNNKVRTLKGMIAIDSTIERGTVFKITLPISSFSTHSLMVRVRQYVYAISNRGVEEILYPEAGEIREIAGRLYYHIEGESYDATVIDDLLHLGPDRRHIERSERPVVIVKDDAGKRHAVLLQAILDSRDVVVKSTGQYLPEIHGVIGATVLGDGSVAPVIDLPDLFRSNSTGLDLTASQSAHSASTAKSMPYALVVDDSLSARRSLQQFAQDLGMNTREARDGMEAVSLMQSKTPDIVLVDMEMPRMNGLELTAHIRADEKTADIPVIMISSRSSEKHKALAAEKGVNEFIVKPFDEDELAAKIHQLLELKNG